MKAGAVMRSSESTETIVVMLVIAIIAGLAGGYFLIRLADHAGDAATPASATVIPRFEQSRPADSEFVDVLRDKEVSDRYEDFFVASCAVSLAQGEARDLVHDKASARQICGCVFPWIQEKIMNKELTPADFDAMNETKQFPSRAMQREFMKQLTACLKEGAA